MAWETARYSVRLCIACVMGCFAAGAHAAATQPASTQPATKPASFEISFATESEGRAAIVDESAEPYFKLLQPLEMAAKTGSAVPGQNLAEQQEHCRKRYQDAVREFTPDEKEALRWYVSKLSAFTYPQYPLLAKTPWKFIKLDEDLEGRKPQIEGRNPFTRGPYVCLPSFMAADMAREMHDSVQGNSDWAAMGTFGIMLLHEQLHVIQRAHRDRFARFYADAWGFTHAEKIEQNPWLLEHQMLDPDGVDQNWVYKLDNGTTARWIWPLSIIPDASAASGPHFSDMKMVAVDLKTDRGSTFDVVAGANNTPTTTNLLNLMGYVAKFAPSSEIFHPNEASADLFARVTLVLDVLPAMVPSEAKGALANARKQYGPLHEKFVELLSEKN